MAGSSLRYGSVVLALGCLWPAGLALGGAYTGRFVGAGSEEYRRVLDVGLRGLAVVALASYGLELRVARGFVAIVLPLAVALSLLLRLVRRRRLHRRRADGADADDAVVTGSVAEVVDLVRHLRRAPHAGFRVVGALVPGDREAVIVDGEPVPVVGGPGGMC